MFGALSWRRPAAISLVCRPRPSRPACFPSPASDGQVIDPSLFADHRVAHLAPGPAGYGDSVDLAADRRLILDHIQDCSCGYLEQARRPTHCAGVARTSAYSRRRSALLRLPCLLRMLCCARGGWTALCKGASHLAAISFRQPYCNRACGAGS